jgi:hypothetical protein
MKWETIGGRTLETLEPRLTSEEEEELGDAWSDVTSLAALEAPTPEGTHGLMRY